MITSRSVNVRRAIAFQYDDGCCDWDGWRICLDDSEPRAWPGVNYLVSGHGVLLVVSARELAAAMFRKES